MKQEYSAGVVVFYHGKNALEFLLLHYQSGHWDFPKGHIEENETKHETALRELMEETGLTAELQPGFQEEFSYFFRYPCNSELVKKKVYFFIGKSYGKKVILSDEHIGFAWLPYEQALEQLTYKNAKELLEKAHEYLTLCKD